jgi:hypothetical protein
MNHLIQGPGGELIYNTYRELTNAVNDNLTEAMCMPIRYLIKPNSFNVIAHVKINFDDRRSMQTDTVDTGKIHLGRVVVRGRDRDYYVVVIVTITWS